MDINKLKKNLLDQEPIETEEAHQCPFCGSYNTDEEYTNRDVTINEYENSSVGSSIPYEIFQPRICNDCGATYTAYFTVDFDRSEE